MKDFENQLDEIRVKLYEETKEMDKEDVIKTVNNHAKKIAHDFNINIISTANKEQLLALNA
jgi:pyruvate formate-lyase activating enzyme-like uncharacterized protein